MKIPQYINVVLNILKNAGFESYLVGGCVRDSLMNKPLHDYDIATNALPNEMLNIFSSFRIIETGLKHGTVTVVSENENVEITTYRIDGKYSDNRRPESVVFTRSIKEDLSRRDFTVNAIAYSPYDGIVDIFGGQGDIKHKIIKCVGNPDTRFNEDGLRIMRALRFSACLGFEIEKSTASSVHKNKELLKNISAERIYSELRKLISSDNASHIMTEFSDVFFIIFPEIRENLYNENAKKLSLVCGDYIARLASLFFSLDEKTSDEALCRLKPDNYTRKNVISLVSVCKETIGTDEISVKRLMKNYDADNIFRIAEIKRVFCEDFDADKFLHEYKRQQSLNPCVSLKQLALNGTDLINLGVKSGAQIGHSMNKILDAIIENRCENSREAIAQFLKREGDIK